MVLTRDSQNLEIERRDRHRVFHKEQGEMTRWVSKKDRSSWFRLDQAESIEEITKDE
jgi:hypothetical protein